MISESALLSAAYFHYINLLLEGLLFTRDIARHLQVTFVV